VTTQEFLEFAQEAQGLASFMSSQLTQAVVTGEFGEALRAAAAAYNATSLSEVVVSKVQVSTVVTIVSEPEQPVSRNSNQRTLSAGGIVGIVIGCIAFAAILLHCRQLNDESKRKRVVMDSCKELVVVV
jgi:LPS O-antigen subunit length determinant protein (WzzB/FepE family)